METKKKNLIRLTFITRIATKLAVMGVHDMYTETWREFCGMLFADEFIDCQELVELLSEKPIVALIRETRPKEKVVEIDTKGLN